MGWLLQLIATLGEDLFAKAVAAGVEKLGAEVSPDKRQRVAEILGPVLPTDVSVARLRQELADEVAKEDTDPPPPATPRPE